MLRSGAVKLFFWKAGGAANNCSENKTRSIKNAAERDFQKAKGQGN
jgi:hypothetical protein